MFRIRSLFILCILIVAQCSAPLAYHNETRRSLVDVSAETTSLFSKPISRKGVKLEKRAISGHSRLIFIAGLEGTGHHAFKDMFSVCLEYKKCEPEVAIDDAAMKFNLRTNMMFGLFGIYSSDTVMNEVATMENRMRKLTEQPGDHLYFIGLDIHKDGGMMSYPNFETRDKFLDNPDIYALALIAESVGLDVRFLVLQRHAQDLLSSDMRRGFGQISVGEIEPQILLSAASTLYGQLSLLDRKFFECVHYHELGELSPERQSQLIDFIHPVTMKDVFPEMLKKVHRHHPKNRRRKLVESMNLRYHGMLLSHTLGLIENICNSTTI